MNKHIFLFIVILVIALFLSPVVVAREGRNPATELETSLQTTDINNEKITVTDVIGREVTFSKPVKKIAFFHPSTAYALLILDVWDMVVGKTGYTLEPDIFPGLEKISSITPPMPSFTDINLEILLSLKPDLLILENSPIPGLKDLLANLDGIVPVVVVNTFEYTTLSESLKILGKILGRETAAIRFLSWSDSIVQTVATGLKVLNAEEKTRVFYKFSFGTAEDIATGTNQLVSFSTISRLTQTINIAEELHASKGWVQKVDQEWLAQQDYDVLIIRDTVPRGFGHNISDPSLVDRHRTKVMSLPALENANAVKKGRVYMIMETFFGTPMSVVSIAYFAKVFYPELFSDLNPEAYLQEYYTRFLRTDIDVSKGVFLYPKL